MPSTAGQPVLAVEPGDLSCESVPGASIDRNALRELMQPDLWRWTVRVAGDWAMIVAPFVLAGHTRHWGAYAFAVVMAGIGQHRIAVMAHEGTHRQISRHKRLNDLLTGLLCLWPFGNPVGGYRRFHFAHHRHLNTELDTELRQKAKSAPAWDLPATRWSVLRYFLRDVCLLHVVELAHLSQRVRPGTSRFDGAMPSTWMLCLAGGLIWYGQWWVIVVWYLGTAMVFWPIFRLRVWTEHVGTDDVHRIHAPWYVRWWLLPHNTWHHYEHHHYPQVPCWNLPRLRTLIGDSPPIVPLFGVIQALESAPPSRSGAPAPARVESISREPAVICLAPAATAPEETTSGRNAKAA